MKKHFKTGALLAATFMSGVLMSGSALADDHAKVGVWGDDQSVSDGTVTAKEDGPIKKDGKLVMRTITAK